MEITRTFRIYGRDGHRQKLSFSPSATYDYSGIYGRGTCILSFDCADKTGSNDFVLLHITADTAQECMKELFGQLIDGFFENCRIGKVFEIIQGEEKEVLFF